MKRFLAIGFLAVCLAAALSPIIAFLSLPVPPIQPRNFTPGAPQVCVDFTNATGTFGDRWIITGFTSCNGIDDSYGTVRFTRIIKVRL